MLVPVIGFVRGDTLGLLLLVHDTDTMAELAMSALCAAQIRVPRTGSAAVYRSGVELPLDDTVGQVGLEVLERIDIVPSADQPLGGP